MRRIDSFHHSIPTLNERISALIARGVRKAWVRKMENRNHWIHPTRFWSLLRRMLGKQQRSVPSLSIGFGNDQLSLPSGTARAFCAQFTVSSPSTHLPNSRNRSLPHCVLQLSSWQPCSLIHFSPSFRCYFTLGKFHHHRPRATLAFSTSSICGGGGANQYQRAPSSDPSRFYALLQRCCRNSFYQPLPPFLKLRTCNMDSDFSDSLPNRFSHCPFR